MPDSSSSGTFQRALAIPANLAGAEACQLVARRNADVGVTWLQSYVSADLETRSVDEGPDQDGDPGRGGPQRPAGRPTDNALRSLTPTSYTGRSSHGSGRPDRRADEVDEAPG